MGFGRVSVFPLTPDIMVQVGKAEYAVRFRTDTGALHLIRNVKNIRGAQGLGSLYLHTWAHRYKGGTPGPHTQAGIIAAMAREKMNG